MRIGVELKEIPSKWFNVVPDLDFTVPPLMSQSGYPVSYHDLASLAPSSIIDQELDKVTREIPIPGEVSSAYADWRPTSLFRADRLEKTLDTPARIFFKYEGTDITGGHEMNTAVPQAYYAAKDKGVKCMVTATANGEWGISLAAACNRFGLECKVYMVRSNYEQKPQGRYVMELLGAEVIASPGNTTRTGKKILAENPSSPGTIAIALSEAFEYAQTKDDTKFAWGAVMNHVLLHQSIIGLESRQQLQKAGVRPDIVIGAVSGGSGFGGLVLPFFREREQKPRVIAVETSVAPSLSKGRYAYDYGDAEGLFPMLKMYTLGHSFVPPGIIAGGMRYHGISPLISALYKEKQIEAKTYTQHQAFEAAVGFARSEGLIASPKTAYAIKAVIDEALICRGKKERKNILFLFDANSNLDIVAFKEFVDGALQEQLTPDDDISLALSKLPQIPE